MKFKFKKSALIAGVLGVLVLGLTGCNNSQAASVKETSRAVEVVESKITEEAIAKNYIGTVDSKDLIKYSFKTAGKIESIHVKVGESISVGDPLASLDQEDLNFKLEGALAQMQGAEKSIQKAKDDLTYKRDLFNKMQSLYEKGSISKDQLDQAKLAKDVSESTYNQAQSQYKGATSAYDQVKSLMSDATIYATKNGTVVSTLYEPREMVAAGYPVVVIRSKIQVVNVGLVQKDLKDIVVGSKATVDINGVWAKGAVVSIAEVPDPATRTYKAEILVSEKQFRIGSIAKVAIDSGRVEGVWLPINIIMSDGIDYVYVVKDGRSFKQLITLKELKNDLVRVEGLQAKSKIVISGMKNISDGSKVNVVK